MLNDRCQSCGMPKASDFFKYGTEKDGSESKDYCAYCYDNGAFTSDVTMDGMIDICLKEMAKGNVNISPENARQMMLDIFPKLKRWANK